MGKIDDLIKELCPDGVEYVKLGNISKIIRGASPRPIKNYLTAEITGIPWIKIGDVSPNDKYITQTAEYITSEGAEKSRYLKKGDFILSNSMSFGRPYILAIDGCIHDGWNAISDYENDVTPNYLYYILKTDTVRKDWSMRANNGGAMTNLNADIVKDTIIPLPPLSIQQQIVEILDTFTDSISNLQEELELREKQMEYYRENLLSFDGEDVEWKSIKDCISSLTTGVNPRQHFVLNSEDSSYHYITGKNINDNKIDISSGTDKINAKALSLINKRAKLTDDILLFASTGTGTVGRMAYVKQYDNSWTVSETLYIIRTQRLINTKFLMYVLNTWRSKKQYIGRISKGSVPHLKISDLLNVFIPVPSLSRQQEIVDILDTFESMITNIKEEIELRQKQYEYYREKLLTFERKGV